MTLFARWFCIRPTKSTAWFESESEKTLQSFDGAVGVWFPKCSLASMLILCWVRLGVCGPEFWDWLFWFKSIESATFANLRFATECSLIWLKLLFWLMSLKKLSPLIRCCMSIVLTVSCESCSWSWASRLKLFCCCSVRTPKKFIARYNGLPFLKRFPSGILIWKMSLFRL